MNWNKTIGALFLAYICLIRGGQQDNKHYISSVKTLIEINEFDHDEYLGMNHSRFKDKYRHDGNAVESLYPGGKNGLEEDIKAFVSKH